MLLLISSVATMLSICVDGATYAPIMLSTEGSPTSPVSLIGTWKTEPTPSPLGPVIITYEFKAEGRVRVAMQQVGDKKERSTEALYELSGANLVIKDRGKEMKHHIKLEGDQLTLTEAVPNGEKFVLHRRPKSSTGPNEDA